MRRENWNGFWFLYKWKVINCIPPFWIKKALTLFQMSKSRASRPTEDPTSKGPKVQFNEAELPGNNKNEHFERKKSPAKTPSPSRKGHGRKKSRSPSSKRVKQMLNYFQSKIFFTWWIRIGQSGNTVFDGSEDLDNLTSKKWIPILNKLFFFKATQILFSGFKFI